MAKGRKTDQASASEQRELTWREERFVEHYVENGGNGTKAYIAAGYSRIGANANASRLIARDIIREAIDHERDRLRTAHSFTRDKAIRILIAMATATVDDFADVLADPDSRESYRGLGDKRYALTSAECSLKFGNSVKLVDRRAALNDLWEKLGLDKDSSEDDRVSFLERFANLGSRLGREGKKEGSS